MQIRYTRRLEDKILIAFSQAIQQSDGAVAEILYRGLEVILERRQRRERAGTESRTLNEQVRCAYQELADLKESLRQRAA